MLKAYKHETSCLCHFKPIFHPLFTTHLKFTISVYLYNKCIIKLRKYLFFKTLNKTLLG